MSDLNKTIRATDIELKDRLVAINRVLKLQKVEGILAFLLLLS